MSATNKTPNIELPLFLGTDIPSWLTDWNGAMTKIDTAISSQTTADEALSVAQGAQTTANAANALATQANQKATDNATLLTSVNTRVDTLSQTVGEQATEITANTNSTANNTTVLNNMLSAVKDADPTQTTLPLWSGAITTKANTDNATLNSMLSSATAQDPSSTNLPTWVSRTTGRLNDVENQIEEIDNAIYTFTTLNPSSTIYQQYIIKGHYNKYTNMMHFSGTVIFNAGQFNVGQYGNAIWQCNSGDGDEIRAKGTVVVMTGGLVRVQQGSTVALADTKLELNTNISGVSTLGAVFLTNLTFINGTSFDTSNPVAVNAFSVSYYVQ